MAEYSTQIAARLALALRAPVRSRALRGYHRFGKIILFCAFCVIKHLLNLFNLREIKKTTQTTSTTLILLTIFLEDNTDNEDNISMLTICFDLSES